MRAGGSGLVGSESDTLPPFPCGTGVLRGENWSADYPGGMSRKPARCLWQQRAQPFASLVALIAAAFLFAPAAVASVSVPSHLAAAQIQSYSATVRVNVDGSLHVSEAVTYDFEGVETSSLERTVVTRERYDADADRVYELSNVVVDAVQTDVDADISTDDTVSTVEVAFPEPQLDQVTVTFDYDVSGAVAETADGLEVRWPVVQGFDVPINQVTVQWNARGVNWLSCLVGPSGSSRPCTTTQLSETAVATMTQLEVAPGDQVVGILGLNADSGVAPSTDLQTRWNITRSFTAEGAPLWTALAVLIAGLLSALGLYWLRGRDSAPTSQGTVRPLTPGPDGQLLFCPPSAVRPGQMGTLVDERADVVDVASTIIDLAVRNYLFVEELARTEFGRHDWLLRRRNDAGDELLAYEREIFEAIFAGGDAVRVSDLEAVLRDRLPGVQALMYDDMVGQGWFNERPDAVRNRWSTAGWVLLAAGAVLTVVLALASTFGLSGVAVVLSGVALAGVGQVAPARTSRGSRVLAELKEFREFLQSPDLGDIPVDQREEMISRFYPYALVFGLGDRWADALAATDEDDTPDDPIYWYGALQNWHLSDAAPTMVRLASALSSAVSSRRLLAD